MVEGTEIKRLRKNAGMTQKDFANLINISQTQLSRWENNEMPVRAKSKDIQRTLEITCKAMERLALVRPEMFSKNEQGEERVIVAPVNFEGIISEGDVLILADKEPQKGSIVLVYEKINHTPERIGRIIEVEGKDKYLVLLPENLIIDLPVKKRYKVIEAVLHSLE